VRVVLESVSSVVNTTKKNLKKGEKKNKISSRCAIKEKTTRKGDRAQHREFGRGARTEGSLTSLSYAEVGSNGNLVLSKRKKSRSKAGPRFVSGRGWGRLGSESHMRENEKKEGMSVPIW